MVMKEGAVGVGQAPQHHMVVTAQLATTVSNSTSVFTLLPSLPAPFLCCFFAPTTHPPHPTTQTHHQTPGVCCKSSPTRPSEAS